MHMRMRLPHSDEIAASASLSDPVRPFGAQGACHSVATVAHGAHADIQSCGNTHRLLLQHRIEGHEATETGFAYAPVSQAHGHNHIVQCHACCTAA